MKRIVFVIPLLLLATFSCDSFSPSPNEVVDLSGGVAIFSSFPPWGITKEKCEALGGVMNNQGNCRVNATARNDEECASACLSLGTADYRFSRQNSWCRCYIKGNK